MLFGRGRYRRDFLPGKQHLLAGIDDRRMAAFTPGAFAAAETGRCRRSRRAGVASARSRP